MIEELLIGCVLCSYLELQVAMKISQNLGPASGSPRVLRGGSWDDLSRVTRSARRSRDGAGLRDNSFGFRVVRELD